MSNYNIENIPRIVLPSDSRIKKFVQLDIGPNNEPFFRVATFVPLHRAVLLAALKEFEINNYDCIDNNGFFPKLATEGVYRAVGMGKCEYFRGVLRLDQGSNSNDYELSPSEEHLERLKPFLQDGLEIIIS